MRKAADPGMVERIAGFLSDNALTRSWQGSVGGAINWAERQMLSDEDLRNVIGTRLKEMTVNEAVSDEQFALLEKLKGGAIDRDVLMGLAAQHPKGVADYLGQSAVGYANASGMQRDALKAFAAEVQTPMSQYGDAAHAAAILATHPAVAYSAVTAGGAMGTAAAMQAYDWLMAQQQAEKESQLALDPSQQPMI